MRHPDIVVVGTGRSGTSFCSYVLQERLGVCMAHQWFPSTKEVAGGYPYKVGAYEEISMLLLTGRFIRRFERRKAEWLSTFALLHRKCSGLVGIKQWRLAMAKAEHWEHIRPRLVVRTFRPEAPTVASMVRYRRPASPERWRKFYWELENNMRKVVDGPGFPCPVVRVDFSKQVSAASLEKRLRPYVAALGKKG